MQKHRLLLPLPGASSMRTQPLGLSEFPTPVCLRLPPHSFSYPSVNVRATLGRSLLSFLGPGFPHSTRSHSAHCLHFACWLFAFVLCPAQILRVFVSFFVFCLWSAPVVLCRFIAFFAPFLPVC